MSSAKARKTGFFPKSCRDRLFAPVDAASLAIFRMCFGAAVSYDLLKFIVPGSMDYRNVFEITGWNFPYPGFEWVVPLSPFLIHLVFGIGGFAAASFAIGLFSRGSAVLMFLAYAYFFLIDSAHFNNHYYLILILAFFSIWMPCNRRFALQLPAPKNRGADGRMMGILRKCGLIRDDSTDSHLIPYWPIFLLRMQLLIVYLFGAIAKMNADWFTGEPIIGSAEIFGKQVESLFPFMSSVQPITYAIIMAWIGLAFDLCIGFIMMIPRSQLLGIALLACFHGINQLTLSIGVFPFLGFTASLIFLAPDWPIQFGRWLRRPRIAKPDWRWFGWGMLLVPGIGALLGWKLSPSRKSIASSGKSRMELPIMVFVVVWIVLQIIIPLRHFTIAGDASWTEEGQFFSWRMMLRQKAAGSLTLQLHDPGIFVKGSQERRIDWNSMPNVKERALYIPINASRFSWVGNKGLNTVYEGIVGYRFVQAVKGVTAEEIEMERNELQSWWKLKTGQELILRESRSLEDCIAAMQLRIEEIERKNGSDAIAKEKASMNQILKYVKDISGQAPNIRAQKIAKVHDYFFDLRESKFHAELFDELTLVHPFASIGVDPPEGQRFWILAQRNDSVELQQLFDSLGRGSDYLIWCDFGRLRFHEWHDLPQWMPVFESGRLAIMWNYFEELNLKQIQQISIRPYMIWQYAQRMARIWEDQFGRRPQIYGFGTVMMNYRYPAPLIDPTVDLASVDYSFWRHNDWITPLKSERIGVSDRVQNSGKDKN